MYWTAWQSLKLLESTGGYLKLLKLFNVLAPAWWATWQNISQLTTSTIKYCQATSSSVKDMYLYDWKVT